MSSALKWLSPHRAAPPLAIGFAILIAISAGLVLLVDRADDDAKGVAHTLEVDTKITAVPLVLRLGESAQRGYLLTQDAQYAAAYRQAVAMIGPALAEIAAITADNPVQRAALDRIGPLVREKIDEMAETIRLNDAGDRAGALALVQTDRGRVLMDQVVGILGQMRAEESRLLRQRRAESRSTNQVLLGLTLFGALMIIALAALAIVIVRRSTHALQAAQAQLAEANEGLEATITERTADLIEANEEIQRFAYIVSHDLRAPLVNIMGFTTELEALRRDAFDRLAELRKGTEGADTSDVELGQDFDEAIGFIKASIAKMDRLINAILGLSREGRRAFTPERIDMKALLQSIADSLAHQVNEAGGSISVGNLAPLVSDKLAVEQVFGNLVDNALKYTRAGVPSYIEVVGRETPHSVVYEVRDNGRGIDAKDRERVFELFRRSGVQDRAGEGIGLAHVRALVRRLGGTIVLSSEPGRGSTFTVTLPKRMAAEGKRKAA